jgi:hypothetical protein
MVILIIIGSVLYNGTYRDILAMIDDFGTTTINRTILSVNPVIAFDKLAHLVGQPSFSSGDSTPYGKEADGLSKAIYGSIVQYYTDITTEKSRQALASRVTDYVQKTFPPTQYTDFFDPEQYAISGPTVERVLNKQNVENLNRIDGDVTTKAFIISVKDLGVVSNISKDEDWHVRTIYQFTKKTEKVKAIGVSEFTIDVSAVSFSNGVVLQAGTGGSFSWSGGGITGITPDGGGDIVGSVTISSDSSIQIKKADTYTTPVDNKKDSYVLLSLPAGLYYKAPGLTGASRLKFLRIHTLGDWDPATLADNNNSKIAKMPFGVDINNFVKGLK